MNPVREFETSALKLWRANIEPAEKAVRLRNLAKAIVHYVGRLAESGQSAAADLWSARARERVSFYLEKLAADLDALATACHAELTGAKR
jgi:hypothetical protein